MRIVNLTQGTPEWLDWRRGKATASVADCIMQEAPSWKSVSTWSELKLAMAGIDKEPSDWAKKAFAHGRRREPVARKLFASTMMPTCIESVDDPRFSASLDGYLLGQTGLKWWCEIKCPASGTKSKAYHAVRKGEIPRYIWWQLVHQAGVIGDPGAVCRLIIFVDVDHVALMSINAYELLEDWPALRKAWLLFLDGDSQRDEWSKRWLRAKVSMTAAKAQLTEAADALQMLGPGESHGVKVVEATRKGSVDWKTMAEKLIPALERPFTEVAEGFRRPSTTSIAIKEVKR